MKDLLQILATYWPSLALLCLSAIPAAYQHAHDHGKLKYWGQAWRNQYSFFGEHQYLRKYKLINRTVQPPLGNWYYNFFWIKYREAFPGSATIFSLVTDCYHASQVLMRILMSLSVTLALSAPWWSFLFIWGAYATVHWAFYKLLSR